MKRIIKSSYFKKSFKSAIGLVLGQGIFTLFIFLLKFLIDDTADRDYFIELLVITRLISVFSLIGIDKHSFLLTSRGSIFNLVSLIKSNKKHFSLVVSAFIILGFLVSYFLFKETSFLFFLVLFILISLNEIQIQILLGRKKYISSQFFQHGFVVLVFTIFYLYSNNIEFSIIIAYFSTLICSYFILGTKIDAEIQDVDSLKMDFKFGASITSGIIVSLFLNGADLFFYKLFYSTGAYDYALLTRVSFLVTLPLIVTNNHFVVDIGKYLKTDVNLFAQSYKKNRQWSFIGALVMSIIVSVLFPLFYKDTSFNFSFKIMFICLIILVMSKCISAFFGGTNNILMFGNQSRFLKNSVIVVLICLIVYPVLIYFFSFVGLVVGNSLILIFQNILNKQSVKKIFNV